MAKRTRHSASGKFPLAETRLSKSDSFRRLYRTGHRRVVPGLCFLWMPSPDGKTRFATLVRKKVAKLAVTRNRLRRMVRETVRPEIAGLPEPCWMLFDVKEVPEEGIAPLREEAFRAVRSIREEVPAEEGK